MCAGKSKFVLIFVGNPSRSLKFSLPRFLMPFCLNASFLLAKFSQVGRILPKFTGGWQNPTPSEISLAYIFMQLKRDTLYVLSCNRQNFACSENSADLNLVYEINLLKRLLLIDFCYPSWDVKNNTWAISELLRPLIVNVLYQVVTSYCIFYCILNPILQLFFI